MLSTASHRSIKRTLWQSLLNAEYLVQACRSRQQLCAALIMKHSALARFHHAHVHGAARAHWLELQAPWHLDLMARSYSSASLWSLVPGRLRQPCACCEEWRFPDWFMHIYAVRCQSYQSVVPACRTPGPASRLAWTAGMLWRTSGARAPGRGTASWQAPAATGRTPSFTPPQIRLH